jgi:hypothetical protein
MNHHAKRVCFVLLSLAAACALAQDAPEAGLVNQVAGEVTYASSGGQPRRAQAFMKVRQGDRFSVPAGALARLVYFEGGRQETWKGPAAFTVGTGASKAATGAPEVAMLPGVVPVKMAKLPEMVQAARLGGITVRGAPPRPQPTAEEQAELVAARDTYRTLRGSASDDDVTPELFLLTVLQEHGRYAEMPALLDAMAKRQPLSPEMQEFAAWVKTRNP